MAKTRRVNSPISVYQGGDVLYQVLAKLPQVSGEHEMWLVAVSSPRELELTPQEVYAESLQRNGRLVWSEGDGPLPAEYRFESR